MNAAVGFITASVQSQLDTILIKPKRSIGAFIAQVTLREVSNDDLEITSHPVEQGAAITDHAFKRPAEVTIECGWSNSPSETGATSQAQVRDVYAGLLSLQESRVPFDVVTGKRSYKNMLFKNLSVTTDKQTEDVLMVTATLFQVLLVQTSIISVPAASANQTTPSTTLPTQNNGTQSLIPSTKYVPGTRGSQ